MLGVRSFIEYENILFGKLLIAPKVDSNEVISIGTEELLNGSVTYMGVIFA